MSIKTVFVVGPAYSGRTTFCNTFVDLNPEFSIDKMWTSNPNANPKYYHKVNKETIDEHLAMFDAVFQTLVDEEYHAIAMPRNKEGKIFVVTPLAMSYMKDLNNSLVVILDPERDFILKNFLDSNFYESERTFAKKTIELWGDSDQWNNFIIEDLVKNILYDEDVVIKTINTSSQEYRNEAAELIKRLF